MERKIEFIIDGSPAGSATLFIENGEIDTTNAEDKFWKAVRFDRDQLIEDEKEHIIDNLTDKEEDKLKEAHADVYIGTDDDIPDAYEDWLMDLSLDELKKII